MAVFQPGGEPTGYLSFDAVDQAAAPLGDWMIDMDALPRGTTLRLVLKLWISAGGALDRWELVGDMEHEALARRALAGIDQTRIQPAMLNHVAVPSFRQLEMVLSRE